MLGFIALYLVIGGLTLVLLGKPASWLVGLTGQRFRIDELLELVAALGTTAVMIRAVDKRPWSDVGLSRGAARPRLIAEGWLVGMGAIGITCAVLALCGWLRIIPAAPGSSLGAGARVTLFLLIAALFEEVLCRGYLLTALRDGLGTRGAVVVSSALFGVLHVANPGATWESVLIVTLAGVFLAWVRFAYDSLYAAWAAHAAWNWVMAVPLHARVSGAPLEAPDYRAVTTGPEWISGGSWGPEGGLVAVMGMLAAMAYLYTRRRREES